MLLFLALLLTPIIEIVLFIQLDDAIGLWPTLGVVVATAVIGTVAIRSQGLATLRRLQSLSAVEETPRILLEGMLIVAAGLLLLTPGVLTDTIGLSLLIPPIRRAAAGRLARGAVFAMASGSSAQGRAGAYPGSAAPDPAARRQPPREPEETAPASPFRRRGRAVSATDAEVIAGDQPDFTDQRDEGPGSRSG